MTTKRIATQRISSSGAHPHTHTHRTQMHCAATAPTHEMRCHTTGLAQRAGSKTVAAQQKRSFTLAPSTQQTPATRPPTPTTTITAGRSPATGVARAELRPQQTREGRDFLGGRPAPGTLAAVLYTAGKNRGKTAGRDVFLRARDVLQRNVFNNGEGLLSQVEACFCGALLNFVAIQRIWRACSARNLLQLNAFGASHACA